MADEWNEPPGDDGITLGPEEALEREIAKSKALKVERLQLRNRIEVLEEKIQVLEDEQIALQNARPNTSPRISGGTSQTPGSSAGRTPIIPAPWTFLLLAFNVAALGIFLMLYLNR